MHKHIIGEISTLSWGTLSFDPPLLADLQLPYFDIQAPLPGPKLAIIAGMRPC
ncbi:MULTISPECIES: hypothetical protein [Pseudomonas]|uniref:Uncharacterized protein n=1 Tax=Pseudomonas frederiksbergensis TaxID=104087 RepID=A0A6L5C246_9PSED|nr:MULTISPECIES: hypothetical protein [Pseudomonas]KAF2394723.1 hypothetical protein FX983_02705 [Pseudomonas frederiksbergensis]MDN3221121.1 hypothetical protein [Pseudomonas nunensis]